MHLNTISCAALYLLHCTAILIILLTTQHCTVVHTTQYRYQIGLLWWQSGLRDFNSPAWKIKKIDEMTDKDEFDEANKYLDNPING